MALIKVDEINEGQRHNFVFSFLSWIWLNIILLPFQLVYFLFGSKKKYVGLENTSWVYWKSLNNAKLERKLIAETGFDGLVKFYRIRSSDLKLNRTLENRIFGEFFCETEYGIFLREFDSPNNWPISYLVFADKTHSNLKRLKKVNSSWIDWRYEFINDKDFNVITEPGKTYTTWLRITFEK